jgi:hypothetical protein
MAATPIENFGTFSGANVNGRGQRECLRLVIPTKICLHSKFANGGPFLKFKENSMWKEICNRKPSKSKVGRKNTEFGKKKTRNSLKCF